MGKPLVNSTAMFIRFYDIKPSMKAYVRMTRIGVL